MPLTCEVDHEIKLNPGAHRRAYKMADPEAIKLKEQLRQLLEQVFI